MDTVLAMILGGVVGTMATSESRGRRDKPGDDEREGTSPAMTNRK
jgi:hypothetical protein